MAPTSHQPLLASPNHKRTSPCKVLLVLVFLVAIIGSLCLVAFRYTDIPPSSPTPLNVARICDRALDRNACLAMVLAEVTPDKSLEQLNGVHLLHTLLKKTTRVVKQTTDVANKARLKLNDPREQAALLDCADLMDMSHNRLIRSVDALKEGASTYSLSNTHAWLSSVLTNHITCLDGLHGSARSIMEPKLNELIARARASLAVMVAVTPAMVDELRPLRRGFPAWVTTRDRKLLESPPNAITSNVVVAQDGSGDYKTIQEAVTAAPNNSDIRYVIYIKNGTYNEKVDIPVTKKNLMLTGDGMDLTVITGSLNVDDGSTTFNSATVAAVADGFIAQDLCFQNMAGPQKHQAVALRVGADRSVINRCKIDAYQDTLYTHSLRQFYRDCYITGTVDFIFGNAAVVFQNSQLVARKPMSGQGNMVTAQGRTDPNQNTGTSIQNCDVIASSDLEPVKGSIKSYLGRPWKEYSRTVVMQSNISDHIDPAGWSVWSGDFALSTLYYGEYLNRGPGAGTSQRVKWAGYHVITSASEAQNFTVASLIQGGSWLKDTGVLYTEGL